MTRTTTRTTTRTPSRPSGAEVRIRKSSLADSATVFSNRLVRNRTGVQLTAVARVLLLHLLTLPADWTTNAERLAEDFTEGRDRVRKALTELCDTGFMHREKIHDPKTGRWVWVWDVCDQPGTFPLEADDAAAADEFDEFDDADQGAAAAAELAEAAEENDQVTPSDWISGDGVGPTEGAPQNPRSGPATENQGMDSQGMDIQAPVSFSYEEISLSLEERPAAVYETNETNEGIPPTPQTTPAVPPVEPAPVEPAPWAWELITSLDFGRHRRPSRAQATELACLAEVAHLTYGLTPREILRHARVSLQAAQRNAVRYLQGAFEPENLPVPIGARTSPASSAPSWAEVKAQQAALRVPTADEMCPAPVPRPEPSPAPVRAAARRRVPGRRAGGDEAKREAARAELASVQRAAHDPVLVAAVAPIETDFGAECAPVAEAV